MQPDVEAFLVRGGLNGGREPSATSCHRRLLRAGRPSPPALAGFDGGSEANRKLDDFFADIERHAQ